MKSSRKVLVLLSLAALPLSLCAQEWVKESNAITLKVLEAQARISPESVASYGLEEFDAETMDLGPGIYERQQSSNRALVTYVTEQRATTEHPKVLQDLDLLTQALEDGIHSRTLTHEKMLPFQNMPRGLYFSFRGLLDPRNDPERYPAALERLAGYTGADGGEPIMAQARARSTERFDVAGLVGPYRGMVERELNNFANYQAGIRQLFQNSGLEGWEEGLDTLDAQIAEFADWVEEEILPRARDEYRLPQEIYADRLKNYGVRMEPEELIRIAQAGFQEIKSQMRSLARQIAAQRGWENGELMHVMRELKKEQIPDEEILDVYKARLADIEDLIREHDVVTLPEREASIRLATEAESAAMPAPFMSPPQLIGNTGQYGEFVLVQSNASMQGEAAKMDDWSHHSMTWAMTVHEARPGHEMQFASLVEDGVSMARVIYAMNSANTEGWGLYSEAIMMEYLPLEGQLFTLFGRLQRAARMFMDPMVNLGLMTPDEAIAFMREQIGLSEAMARSEADRYSFRAPGQATSYYYGYLNLQRLRTEVELKLGNRFKQRAFHDFLLAQGPLPPDLLRRAVLDEFLPSQ